MVGVLLRCVFEKTGQLAAVQSRGEYGFFRGFKSLWGRFYLQELVLGSVLVVTEGDIRPLLQRKKQLLWINRTRSRVSA